MGVRKKVSASFLKKRRPARGSKKLSLTSGRGALVPTPPGAKVFLLLFFQKKKRLLTLPLAAGRELRAAALAIF